MMAAKQPEGRSPHGAVPGGVPFGGGAGKAPPPGGGQILSDLRQMGVWEAVANQTAFMATPHLMPSLFARTGWAVGIGFTLYSAALTYCTGVIIGDICCQEPGIHSYGLLAEAAFGRWGAQGGRWRCRLAAFGPSACAVLQFACYYLTGVAELIYFGEYLGQMFGDAGLCQRSWLAVAAAIAWPCVQIPTFRESRWVAALTIAMFAFGGCVLAYEILLVRPWSECDLEPRYPQPGVAQVLRGLTGIGYAFGGHGIFPEQLREMKEPARWPSVMRWTYGVVTPTYLLFGAAGYFAYGDKARANLNANFPNNWANTASIATQSVAELYYISGAMLALVLRVELALGVSPTAWCGAAREEGQCDAEGGSSVTAASTEPASACSPTGRGAAAIRDVLSMRACGLPPVVFRLLWRTAFLGSMVLLASWFVGGPGDVLLSVQALAGAVGYMALTYILPLFFGWVLLPRTRGPVRAFYAVSFVLCSVVMAVGVVFDAQELLESVGGFGAPVQCVSEALAFAETPCGAALGSAPL